MDKTPFILDFDELYASLSHDTIHQEDSLYLAHNKGIFDDLLVQQLNREIDGEDIAFLAIRNIVVKPEYREQNLFTSFVNKLSALNRPIMFHDVINDELVTFFEKRRYLKYYEIKYAQEMLSFYFL